MRLGALLAGLGAALAGCGGGETPGGDATLDLAAYVPLDGSRTWTWRDDGGEDAPADEALVRGRVDADGAIELRRGLVWSDGAAAGTIRLALDAGLVLEELAVGEAAVEGPVRLADALPEDGDRNIAHGWTCATALGVEVDTFYALYDDALRFDCEDGGGAAWSFGFGAGAGPVRVEGPGLVLDLVAPW